MRCGRELMLALALHRRAARARGRRARGRCHQRQRADALRREGQRLSQAAVRPRRGASPSRPRIRPMSASIVKDQWAPDFTNCDMSSDPAFKFEKRRLTIYETEEWQLVGLTFPSFWRPNQVPVRVGNRVETGFHLLQLWTALSGARRGGAGALSRRRLLARAAAAAAEPALERLRLVVPDRPGGDRRPAVRRHQGRGVRSGDAQLHLEFRARRQRDAAARQARPGAHRARRGA